MVEVLIECPGELPPVLPMDLLPPPVPDRDQRGGPELLPDLPVQILGIVPLVQDIDGRWPGPVAPGEQRPRMDDIVTEVSRYPDAGDHLFSGIDRDGGFQVAPAGLSGSPSIIGTCIGARDPRGVDGGDRNDLAPSVRQPDHFLQDDIEVNRPDPLQEFLQSGEVGDPLQLEELCDSAHQLDKVDGISVVGAQDFLEQDKDQVLVLGVGSPRIFAGIVWYPGALDNRDECLN